MLFVALPSCRFAAIDPLWVSRAQVRLSDSTDRRAFRSAYGLTLGAPSPSPRRRGGESNHAASATAMPSAPPANTSLG